MKAVVKTARGKGNTVYMDVDMPQPGPNDVKIAVKAASICSSDLHCFCVDSFSTRMCVPVVLGHEGAGVVVETGCNVTHVKSGDRVMAHPMYSSCGICSFCLEGRHNICAHKKSLGSQLNGYFAEYTIASSVSTFKLPKNISFEAAALTEPLACVTHAVLERAKLCPGDSVAVFGPGTMGLLTVQVAKAVGCRVVLIGFHDEERLILGEKLGADLILDNSKIDIFNEIEKAFPEGISTVFDASGSVQAIRNGWELVKPGGQFVMEGLIREKEIPLDYNGLFYNKELKFIGVRSATLSACQKALKLMEYGLVDTEILVGAVLPLADWEKGYDMVENKQAIKVVLKP